MDDPQRAYEVELKAHKEEWKEYKKELRASYENERKLLNESSLSVAGFYEKGIIFTIGGTVGISLVFIEKIAPTPQGYSVFCLVVAWISLGIALLCHLFALAFSQRAVRRQLDIVAADYNRFANASPTNIPRAITRTNKHTATTLRLSGAAIWLVFVGVVASGAFFVGSIIEKKDTKHGSLQSAPPTHAPALATSPSPSSATGSAPIPGKLHPAVVSDAAPAPAATPAATPGSQSRGVPVGK